MIPTFIMVILSRVVSVTSSLLIGCMCRGTGLMMDIASVVTGFARRLAEPACLASCMFARQYMRNLFAVLVLFAGAIGLGFAHQHSLKAAYMATRGAAVAPALYDAGGRFIGILPSDSVPDGRPDILSHYVSIPAGQSPDKIFICLRSLEDRHFLSWPTVVGFEPASAGKTVLGMAAGRGGGHSPLVSQVARSMKDEIPSGTEAPLQKLERKLGEWKDSPALTSLLGSGRVDPARFVLDGLPLLAGSPGSHAGALPRGAEAAALIVFRKSVAQLKPEEAFILAAADNRPILLAPDGNSKALKWTDRRWLQLQKRASRCLPLLGATGTEVREEAERHLFALPPPRIGAAAEQKMTGTDMNFGEAVNPVRRSRLFLGDGGLNAVHHELQAVSPGGDSIIADARLGIDGYANIVFRKKINASLARIEAREHSHLALRLTGSDAGNDRAQVIVVLAVGDGTILRFYQAGPGNGFDAIRPIASIAKAVIAGPVLGKTDDPSTLYCNEHVQGLHEGVARGGSADCRTRNAWVTARQAYARSLIEPFVNRLRRVPPDELRREASSLGFKLPEGVSPAASVPLGLVEASPRTVLQAMIAIGRALANEDGDVAPATMVKMTGIVAANRFSESRAVLQPVLAGAAVKREIAPASAYLRDVLAAPLGAGGTLSALADLQASRNPTFVFNIAKTGTSSTPGAMTRDAMIAGTFELSDHRVFAWLVLAGTADPRRPLGSIGGGSLAPLARIAIEQATGGQK